jgi:hypothetical protein
LGAGQNRTAVLLNTCQSNANGVLFAIRWPTPQSPLPT